MRIAELTLDKAHLSRLAPLNILSPELLDELIRHAAIRQLPPGQKAFEAGEKDNRAVFLLSGQLALVSEGRPPTLLKAGSTAASQPLANHQPRQTTALASTNVTILSIDAQLLEELIDRNRATLAADARPPANTAERLDEALKLPIFATLPRPYLKVIAQRFVAMPVRAGAPVIRQGDEGKYYYLIAEGAATVTRRAPHTGHVIDVAELGRGAGFGEESLIVGGRHNSNVTMTEDGHLLRLSRGEFMTLIVRPLVRPVPYGVAATMQQNGAVLLDVRPPAAFIDENLHGSVNLPVSVLRRTASLLDKRKEYIVCSDNGGRSIIAAFLLAFQGIKVHVMEGTVAAPA